MKKVLLSVVFVLCAAVASAWAQSAKVVDVKGAVTVKLTAASEWQKAQINMLLEKDAEVQTQKDSQCTLAFDEALKNILTLQGDSRIKIQNVSPGEVFLPQGRVFTLIGNMPKGEEFQVRTPTAVAGARGTGWLTSFINGKTDARVFDHKIFLQCVVDDMVEEKSGKELDQGYGAEIGGDRAVGDTFSLDEGDWREWEDFKENIGVIRGDITIPGEEDDAFGDAKDDQNDGIADAQGERQREAGEEPPGDGYEEF
jgi:hypothetical protein